ncbi:erythromycin esterase family protein [Clostridium sp. D33t1_170424_F3]|uniref:erythromycin esterase family protein n=1 Tax=Clostridium sp. D33t1_170424_F3 TaxID=2787099 RepID=UPI00256FEFF4|nr:erythromycin esterase family protein [Clostridium sp. D33t1_170424_F3]
MKRTLIAAFCIFVMLFNVFGCSADISEEDARLLSDTTDISGIEIPENVRVVALGESTHGTKEYHIMRKDVFSHLLDTYGCRTFLLEASFGSCLYINQYILGGSEPGTAGEAIQYLESWVYHTNEFKQLIEWMHDYNQTVEKDKQLHFYGVDMQEGAHASAYLLSYIRSVFPDKANDYEPLLSVLKDPSYPLEGQDTSPVRNALEQIQVEMEQSQDQYIENSSLSEFQIARECIQALKEFVMSLSFKYVDPEKDLEKFAEGCALRDSCMAARVETILALDQADMVFLTGHNAHVTRRSAIREGIPPVKAMGELLSDRLGDAYFSIGTAFCEGTLKAIDYNQGGFKEFYVKETHPFIKLFANLPGQNWYINFSDIKESDPAMQYLEEEHDILNVGAVYSRELDFEGNKDVMAVRFPATLKNEWDGMLIYKKTNPTIIRTRF